MAIRLCGQCGANVPSRFTECELCAGAPSTHAAPTPVDRVSWVQLRARVWCRQCRQKSPMSFLSDGGFYCIGCQQDRKFDPAWWTTIVFPIADAAADAFWGDAGVFSPWPKFEPEDVPSVNDLVGFVCAGIDTVVGHKHAGQSVEEREGNHMVAAPGHPLCATCSAPATATVAQRGRVTIACAACKTSDTFDVPASLIAQCAELVGVIAPEHATGYVAARIERNAAAVSVLCPSCAAPLSVTPGARLTRCTYCQASALIPDRLGEPARVPHPLWLAFRSPSAIRRATPEGARAHELDSSEPLDTDRARAFVERTDPRDDEARKLDARLSDATRLALAADANVSDAFAKLWTGSSNAELRATLARRPTLPRDLVKALAGDAEPRVRVAIAAHPALDLDLETQRALAADSDLAIRAAIASRSKLDAPIIEVLAADSDPAIRAKIAVRDDVPPEILARLRKDPSPEVVARVNANPNLKRGFFAKLFG